jgi:hypothetical protein
MTTQPSLADDLLNGSAEIAEYVGWPRRRVEHLISRGLLPVRKIGQRLYARKTQLDKLLTPDAA